MKIIGIGGSLRNDSYTYKTLKLALSIAEKAKWETELIDLRNMQLPFCDGGRDHLNHADVKHLKQSIKTAQGIILVSPEYHGSVTGVLKNALDLIDEKDIQGKVIAIIGILGGMYGYGSIANLAHICRQLHAWVVPHDLLIPHVETAFDDKGNLRDPFLNKRMEELMNELLHGAKKLHE